jgi:hypothetical protein
VIVADSSDLDLDAISLSQSAPVPDSTPTGTALLSALGALLRAGRNLKA